eukprot:NODE_12_length_54577_cov_0.384100.p23 type:complete len:276 gc:universal NODE_12_length_54577_cov_0.384100:17841-18668(+)
MSSYKGVDAGFYIAFGASICANLQGLVLSPALLQRSWKRNLPVVFSNICFIISNWVAFYENTMECSTSVYVSELFMVLGSLFEVLAPLTRAYPLFSDKVKKMMLALIFSVTVAEFTSLVSLNYDCEGEETQFPNILVNMPSEVISHILGVAIYFLAFSKIIALVNSSSFSKENGRMQLLKSISLWSMYAVIGIKVGTLIGFLFDGDSDNEVEMAMKSNLVMVLIVSQLTLELANKAAGKPGNSQDKSDKGVSAEQSDKTTKKEVAKWGIMEKETA